MRCSCSKPLNIASIQTVSKSKRCATLAFCGDQAFKTAYRLFHEYDAVAMESLRPLNMMQNPHFAKAIQDAGWGVLEKILHAKANEWEREVVKVDPRGTSQECSACAYTIRKALSEHRHICPECGLDIHRDVNDILKRSGLGGAIGDSLDPVPIL